MYSNTIKYHVTPKLKHFSIIRILCSEKKRSDFGYISRLKCIITSSPAMLKISPFPHDVMYGIISGD